MGIWPLFSHQVLRSGSDPELDKACLSMGAADLSLSLIRTGSLLIIYVKQYLCCLLIYLAPRNTMFYESSPEKIPMGQAPLSPTPTLLPTLIIVPILLLRVK